jgi:quercetin dioxygenase-like cupin family protein
MANSSTPDAGLPAPRLVVTTHTDDGTSTFLSDKVVDLFHPFGPAVAGFGRFDSHITVPVSNATSPPDFAHQLPRCPPSGVVFTTSDFPGNYTVPMHRTISLDYAAVISGEIVLKLDSGEEKTVKAGEFIVQRGTNHQWINRTDKVCRVVFVMVGAEKIELPDGRVLEETILKKP